MFTHCYKKKNGKEFIDFIQRVDSLYDSSVKTIFFVLDNVSIYIKQRKLKKQAISNYYPRITLVLLPIKSPEINLIEVRWMWFEKSHQQQQYLHQ
jgi:hypothetical protein